jgi:hypothetical protein
MRWLLLPVLLQAQASIGFGVGTVRYAGGSSLSVASLSPGLQYVAPTLVLRAGAAVAALPHGDRFAQGRADLWAATPPLAGGWRLGAEGSWSATTHSADGKTTALHGVAEVLWVRPGWGVGVGAGPSAGWISGTTSVTALRTRARAWWRTGGAGWTASLEPTRFVGAWFTDVSASVTVEASRVSATAWGAVRTSAVYGSSGAASAFVQVFLTPSGALELGGGSYLRDPYQGFPRAGFLTVGLRLLRPPRAPPARPTTEPSWPPLIPTTHGDTVTIRFQMPHADSVAIAGDWNGWAPVPLRALAGEVWEARLRLAPGTYHFNLLVDGKEWVVPRGVATVPDGLGGIVGVLIVN